MKQPIICKLDKIDQYARSQRQISMVEDMNTQLKPFVQYPVWFIQNNFLLIDVGDYYEDNKATA